MLTSEVVTGFVLLVQYFRNCFFSDLAALKVMSIICNGLTPKSIVQNIDPMVTTELSLPSRHIESPDMPKRDFARTTVSDTFPSCPKHRRLC